LPSSLNTLLASVLFISGCPQYSSLLTRIREYFFSVNVVAEVVNKLEETTYYQESHAVKEYLDEFQTLILEASYTNLYMIVVKFHYFLRIAI